MFVGETGWCPAVGIIIVFIAGDAPCAPIGLWSHSAAIRGSID